MRIISLICGLALLFGATFFAGMWTTHKVWAPWRVINELRPFVRSYRDTGYALPQNSYRKRLSNVSDVRYVRHSDDISDGTLFLVRMVTPENYAVAELLDKDGQVLHSWPIVSSEIFDQDTPYPLPHGVQPLPDGSLLVNFDGGPGVARVNACGKAMWTQTSGQFHHSIALDERGGFWTWGTPRKSKDHEQTLDRISIETGEILERIDLIDDVVLNPLNQAFDFGAPEDYEFVRDAAPGVHMIDIFHPNDIEPLDAALADAFPLFEAGDLMMSLRNLNLVAVIDRQTHETLWLAHGPWRDQHDPDFEPDGTISIFSNYRDRDRNAILAVDPVTNETRDVFAETGLRFFSDTMGKHERLPNGNWLIISAMEGRVIEASSDGQILREFVNLITPDYNGIVPTADVLPVDFYDELPSCAQ